MNGKTRGRFCLLKTHLVHENSKPIEIPIIEAGGIISPYIGQDIIFSLAEYHDSLYAINSGEIINL